MFYHLRETLDVLEKDHCVASLPAYLAALRRVGLGDFGSVLWHAPHPGFPKTAAFLPPMASEETQRKWTGTCGAPLLQQTLGFMRSVAENFARHCGHSLSGKRMLDFGCGYGRIMRLMLFYTDPEKVCGVDPMPSSLEECAKSNLDKLFHIARSDYLPDGLPVTGSFDLISAFSVFTHLSRHTFQLCLATLRHHLAENGLLALTIRPPEYWRLPRVIVRVGEKNADRLYTEHVSGTGFAFIPHRMNPHANALDRDHQVTYGDTSVRFDVLAELAKGWTIVGYDRSIDDSYQIYVFLK